MNKKKEYLATQVHKLAQLKNTQNKERQLKVLQILAKEQISLEVRNMAQLVHSVAKQNLMSLAKERVPKFCGKTVSAQSGIIESSFSK